MQPYLVSGIIGLCLCLQYLHSRSLDYYFITDDNINIVQGYNTIRGASNVTTISTVTNEDHRTRYNPRILIIDEFLHVDSLIVHNNNSTLIESTNTTILIDKSWYSTTNANNFRHGYAEECQPIFDWQIQSFPNCNTFHEEIMTPLNMRLINQGSARIAFEARYQDEENRERRYVYKTLRYKKNVTERKVEEQRVDALIMERSVDSPFIPDIHGYCGVGVLQDFMPEGNMHDYIKGSRLSGGSTLSPIDKLRVAIHITSGVAALHNVGYFHNDITPHQFLFQNGIFKLNDFNMAKPIYHNTSEVSNDSICRWDNFGKQKYIWKGRSLEEFQKISGYKYYTPPTPMSVDIWMMGTLIYTIYTDQYLFEKPKQFDMKEAAIKMMLGERSPIPINLQSSTDPSNAAVRKALDLCWTQKWQERPSAQDIATYLMNELREIKGEVDPDLKIVLPERDPLQQGTDTDFMRVNWKVCVSIVISCECLCSLCSLGDLTTSFDLHLYLFNYFFKSHVLMQVFIISHSLHKSLNAHLPVINKALSIIAIDVIF